MRRVAIVAWTAVVWTVLWADLDVGTVLAGVLIGVVVTTFVAPGPGSGLVVRPVPLLLLVGGFARDLVVSCVTVAWQCCTWSRSRFDDDGLLECPIAWVNDTVTTLLANHITLTPGTLTVEADERRRVLVVHHLHVTDEAAHRRAVVDLERRVAAAVASRDDLDAAEARWAVLR